MLCSEICPRGTKCQPVSNVISNDDESQRTFVCIGVHGEEKLDEPTDIYRHCFKSVFTDTMHDLNAYDLKSVSSVMADAILFDDLEKE